jgi:ribosomal protein S12 methylthiotransferase
MKVSVITMGCSKNLVDSEVLLQKFADNGLEVEHDPEVATGEIVVINTCGFIGDAKEESVNMILQFANARKRGKIKQLFVMGCLSERYMDDLQKEIPEVDKYFGKFNWNQIIDTLNLKKQDQKYSYNKRFITTPKHYAYLKISEGCNRTCAYCAIPIITGKHKSVPVEVLVEEATQLANAGVKELQVIAQDLSYYGIDIYGEQKLAFLIEKLSEIEGIEWIRLHYAYPSGFPFDVLKVMRENPKVCKYLDIALQHISDPVLKNMRRYVTKAQTEALINRIRNEVPGIFLRTTFMAGFPGETDESFDELMQFAAQFKFERLGVFAYSEEDDTWAASTFPDSISARVKHSRVDMLMEQQVIIAEELNERLTGSVQKVIIDRKEEGYYVGRTQFDSPEVDPEVIIASSDLAVGAFYNVKIVGYDMYDLKGEVVFL